MTGCRKDEGGHGRFLPPWPILVLGLGAALLFAFFGAAPDWAVYSRDGLRSGEVWRIASAHLAHTDGEHLTVNLLALCVLGWAGAACGLSASHQIAALALGAVGVTAGLWVGRPDLGSYCGLSGILNTLFVLVLYAVWRKVRNPLPLLAAGGYAAKVAMEMTLGSALFTSTAWPPVAEAHLCGAIVAIFLLTGHLAGRHYRCAGKPGRGATPPRTPA